MAKIPIAVELGMEGMKIEGKRRILVPPNLGWNSEETLPKPTTGGATRRLRNALNSPVLFEVELVKIRKKI